MLPLALPPISASPPATVAARQISTRIEPYRGMAGVHLGMTEAEARKAVGVPVERFNGDLVHGNLTIRLTETDPARVWAVIAYWPGPDDAIRPKPIVNYRDPKTGISIGRSTRADVRAAYRGRVSCRTEDCTPLPRTRRNADGRCGTYGAAFRFKAGNGGTSRDRINLLSVIRCGIDPDTTPWPKAAS